MTMSTATTGMAGCPQRGIVSTMVITGQLKNKPPGYAVTSYTNKSLQKYY